MIKIWLYGNGVCRLYDSSNDKETMNLELIFTIENFIFKLGCLNSEKSVKIRSKQQAYTHVGRVRETRHFLVVESKATAGKPYWYARHDITESDLHYLPPY